jgi:hypothetical protein
MVGSTDFGSQAIIGGKKPKPKKPAAKVAVDWGSKATGIKKKNGKDKDKC